MRVRAVCSIYSGVYRKRTHSHKYGVLQVHCSSSERTSRLLLPDAPSSRACLVARTSTQISPRPAAVSPTAAFFFVVGKSAKLRVDPFPQPSPTEIDPVPAGTKNADLPRQRSWNFLGYLSPCLPLPPSLVRVLHILISPAAFIRDLLRGQPSCRDCSRSDRARGCIAPVSNFVAGGAGCV